MLSAQWEQKRNEYDSEKKYGGLEFIKIYFYETYKWHPFPAVVFVVAGMYMEVPEHLLGALKYASETINVEQLFVPDIYANKYFKTGKKTMVLVTGSCASVTISAITLQFVKDMIRKHQNNTNKSLELHDEFREEYDTRIKNYLCGKGLPNNMKWFDPEFFGESNYYYIGDDKCKNLN